MKILEKITTTDIKLNKKRTIGIIIGIILSTALITCVGGMFYVFQNTMIQTTIQSDGYWHIELSDVTEEDLNKIKLNKDFSEVNVVKDIGYSITIYDDDYTEGHTYSMDKDRFNFLGYKIIDGKFPTNNKEIAISKNYAKYTNTNIGDEITLNIGDLSYKNEESYIKNGKDYTFKVVGTINAHPTLITTNLESDKNDVYITLKNPKNYKEEFEELLSNYKYEYRKNNDLLRWEVFSFSNNTLSFLLNMVLIVIFVIIITSVFSIRNSFAISTTEKLKTYGMLRSIGATKKQIKKMVLIEGFKLGLIALPLGSLLGLIVTYLLTIIVNKIAISGKLSMDSSLLYYKFSIIPVILAVIFGIIMIYLSTINSKKKASKVSPIQNIRNSSEIKNNKDLRVPKIINKIFKIGGNLSYKNIKRNKKKYRVTTISLTISILVFIMVSCFLNYGIKTLNDEYITLNYNVSANVFDKNQKIDINKLQKLAKSHTHYTEDFDKSGLFYLKDTSHIVDKNMIINSCSRYDKIYSENCIGKEIPIAFIDLLIYDDDSIKDLSNILHLDYNYIKDKGILINNTKIVTGKNTKYIKTSTYQKGDIITFYNQYNDNKLTYEVASLTDYRPWGYENYFGTNSPILIISEKYYPYKDNLIASDIYYEAKDADKLVDEIHKISSDIRIMNIDEEIKSMRSVLLIFSIFIYGFIIVVTLIGITSVFNTITSNLELRKREFAILKSIGMTKKEFNNMILLESVFYSFKSLFYGSILGIIGSFIIYKIFAERIDYGYLFPYKAIIISIIFITLIVYTIMKYSLNRINKQNIIETIRNENI